MGKSAVAVEGTTAFLYLLPAIVAAALATGVLLRAGRRPRARLADRARMRSARRPARSPASLSRSPPGTPAAVFALMGAGRFAYSVFVEGLLLLALVLAALPGEHRPARAQRRCRRQRPVGPAGRTGCALLAFALVVLAETGRQPIDNPDTHLELTMIHEGRCSEYAGRDLAYLQWAAAARHWIVLVLGASFLPTAARSGFAWRRSRWRCRPLRGARRHETWQAKMRILRVPRFAAGAGIGLLDSSAGTSGRGMRRRERAHERRSWVLWDLALAVTRSGALRGDRTVTAQSALLGIGAFAHPAARRSSVASPRSSPKAAVLAALLGWSLWARASRIRSGTTPRRSSASGSPRPSRSACRPSSPQSARRAELEQATVALVAIGIATVALRRATLFQASASSSRRTASRSRPPPSRAGCRS